MIYDASIKISLFKKSLPIFFKVEMNLLSPKSDGYNNSYWMVVGSILKNEIMHFPFWVCTKNWINIYVLVPIQFCCLFGYLLLHLIYAFFVTKGIVSIAILNLLL